MNRPIPTYLAELRTNAKILAFVVLFSLLFISVYNPLEVTDWLKAAGTTGRKFVFSAIAILGGTVIISCSRFALHLFCKKHTMSVVEYCFWLAGEVVLIALAYVIFLKMVLSDPRAAVGIFRSAVLSILLMLAIPYLLSFLYLALKDKDIKVKTLLSRMETSSQTAESAPAIQAEVASTPLPAPATDPHLRFYDDKGDLQLSIRKECVFYVEAADNYVNIHYKKGEKQEQLLVRTTLKSVEEFLQKQGIVRCHRSYLVNTAKIKIIRKERDGFFADFDVQGVPDLPISKTYAEEVLQLV